MPQPRRRYSCPNPPPLDDQKPLTPTLSGTPISNTTPILTTNLAKTGIAGDPPPYSPNFTWSLPPVTSCSCVANASHPNSTQHWSSSYPSSYAHAEAEAEPQARFNDEDCYEDPLGFSYGYDNASPTKYVNEEDSEDEDALSDWQWGILDILYSVLYAALILGVVLNVDALVGRWGVGSSRDIEKDKSRDMELWSSSNGRTNGRMSGAGFNGVGASSEVQICHILLSAYSDSRFIETTYDKPPSRIYRFLTPSVLKHCRTELAALTHTDGVSAAKPSAFEEDNDYGRENVAPTTETKEGKFLNVNENTAAVTESEKTGMKPAETELRPSIINMPDDLAEEGILGRVRPNHMHAGFGGPWR